MSEFSNISKGGVIMNLLTNTKENNMTDSTTATKASFKVVSAAKMKKGDIFQGTYKGQVELKFGPGYVLETDEGDVALAGAKRLGYALEKVTPGAAIEVTYEGKGFKKYSTGVFEGHDFSVTTVG